MVKAINANHKHIEDVFKLIKNTEKSGMLTHSKLDGLTGISGLMTVGLLQRLAKQLAKEKNICYLEIGVFQGLTLVSTALAAPNLPCFGIDNFATLDPEEKNKTIVRNRLHEFNARNATLIDSDFEEALEGLNDYLGAKKVGVFFIDGPHDYRSQLVCLMLIKPYLHERAVIVVDDANYPDVRWSTKDFLLGHPEFKLLFDAYSPAHPTNMTSREKEKHRCGWLNGIHVLIRDQEDVLPKMFPPTNAGERNLYLNEWLAHRLRMAEMAPESLRLADAICTNNKAADKLSRRALKNKYEKNKDRLNLLFDDRNVFSKDLPLSRFNLI